MKIFLDTNIFLDYLLKRENFEYSRGIIQGLKDNLYQIYLSDITILNIFYIGKKQLKVDFIKNFIRVVNRDCTILGVDNNTIFKALELNNLDLEDSVQYLLAENENIDVIITNDKGFYIDKIKTLTSKNFVDEYIKA